MTLGWCCRECDTKDIRYPQYAPHSCGDDRAELRRKLDVAQDINRKLLATIQATPEGGFLEEIRHQLEDTPGALLETISDALAYVKEALVILKSQGSGGARLVADFAIDPAVQAQHFPSTRDDVMYWKDRALSAEFELARLQTDLLRARHGTGLLTTDWVAPRADGETPR